MKKLITLFSFLAVLSLLFIGCQGADELTSPVDDLSKGINGTFTWGDPLLGTLPYTVDLVAGQFNVVGSVTIEKIGNGLKVTYNLDDEDCSVTDVHVDVTYNQINFHVNSTGNPEFGNFDSKLFNATIIYNGNEATVEFSDEQLKAALGGIAPNVGQKIYIAAHSVVCCNGGSGSGAICPNIPVSDVLTYADNENPNYYVNLTFTGLGILPAWCVDAGRGFGSLPMTHYFLCSYNLGDLSCVVDYPQNLDAANWLINNRGSYHKDAIQGALWALLSDDTEWQTDPNFGLGWQEVRDLALANGEGFVPQCGQKVLIIAFNQDPDTGTLNCNNITSQVLAFEREVPCEQSCETAMAFPYEPDNYSSLFPGHVWFRYIAFNW